MAFCNLYGKLYAMHATILYILTDLGRTQMYIGQSNLLDESPKFDSPISSFMFPGRNLDQLIYIENFEKPEQAEKRKSQLLQWRKSKRWKFIQSVNPGFASLKNLSSN